MTTHDFGSGPVAAHRHTNPDGTEGGWVADTAHVDATAYIGPYAIVADHAIVADRAIVTDHATVADHATMRDRATVRDRAIVRDYAIVEDHATVWGCAAVRGGAAVGGDAIIRSLRDLLTVGPVGSEDRIVTIHRTTDGHRVVAGCWSGTLDELAARIAPGGGHDWSDADEARWRADYEAVIALGRARVAEWDAEQAAAVAS